MEKVLTIHPISYLRGTIDLPGDKSISHRYAILGALAEGRTRISNFSSSQDCQSTLNCLQALGATVRRVENEVTIDSPGWKHFRQPREVLDAQNSGTTIRLLSALLASSPFVSTIGGDDSLNQRPMKRIITPLTQMGAEIEARHEQYPPLKITGTRLRGIRHTSPVASAQVKSCVLLAGVMAQGQTTVIEKIPSRDHTERALPFFGVSLEKRNHELSVTGEVHLSPAQMQIPADFSSSVYFLLSALLVPDSDICLRQVEVNPSRTGLLTLLEECGAWVEKTGHRVFNGEPACDLTVRFSRETLERFPSELAAKWVPNLIDEIPALAIFGTRLKRGLTVRNAGELRKKESDRIHSIVFNLRNLGISLEEFPDGFHIPPGQRIRGGKVQTFGDHRIAMSFAMAGLIAEKPLELDQPACVRVSFPGFFEKLESLSS